MTTRKIGICQGPTTEQLMLAANRWALDHTGDPVELEFMLDGGGNKPLTKFLVHGFGRIGSRLWTLYARFEDAKGNAVGSIIILSYNPKDRLGRLEESAPAEVEA